jgi:hypothetical protein
VSCAKISWTRFRTGCLAAREERAKSTEHRGGATAPWERGRLARRRPLRVHDTLTPASQLQPSHPNLDTPDARSPPTRTAAHREAVAALRDAAARCGETWTAPRLATWLATTHGVRVDAAYLAARLCARTFRWKRTKRSVPHPGMPDLPAPAKAELEVVTV